MFLLALLYPVLKSKLLPLINTAINSSGSIPQSLTVPEEQIYTVFAILLALYFFISLLVMNGTIGMKIANIYFVRSDKNSVPHKLTVVQKFIRGFIGGLLAAFIFYINLIIFPFDLYRRSLSDFMSGSFVLQRDTGSIKRGAYAWLAVAGMFLVYIVVGVILLLLVPTK